MKSFYKNQIYHLHCIFINFCAKILSNQSINYFIFSSTVSYLQENSTYEKQNWIIVIDYLPFLKSSQLENTVKYYFWFCDVTFWLYRKVINSKIVFSIVFFSAIIVGEFISFFVFWIYISSTLRVIFRCLYFIYFRYFILIFFWKVHRWTILSVQFLSSSFQESLFCFDLPMNFLLLLFSAISFRTCLQRNAWNV